MKRFNRIYFYGGGIIMLSTAIITLYYLLFGYGLDAQQFGAAVILTVVGAGFMGIGWENRD